jgi:hypothetical protein
VYYGPADAADGSIACKFSSDDERARCPCNSSLVFLYIARALGRCTMLKLMIPDAPSANCISGM